MSSEYSKEIIEEKNRKRLSLRNEYLKKITNPHIEDAGHLFDAGIQRFVSLRATKAEFFKETPATIWRGLFLVIIPLGLFTYALKNSREKKEADYRAGKVAYKDRLFKFI